MRHNKDLQNKIFKTIVVITFLLSIISIIGNIIFGFPYQTNFKWIIMGLLSFFTIIGNKFKIKYLKLIYFIIIIIVLVPYGFLDSGGSNNNTIAYIFLIMISITFLFQGKIRTTLIMLLIVTFITMFCLEQFYPQLIKEHTNKSQFLDRLIQIPITLICGFLLLKQFADAYVEEKEKLAIYSQKLKTANKRLKFMVSRDELTELYNRRAFNEKIEEILKDKSFYNKEIYIILFDIDNFKDINDTYGHSVGDDVICKLSKTAKDIMPETNFISRWGGDEFTIIFFGNLKEVKKYMDKLYSAISNIDNKQAITISAGITEIKKNDSQEEVFKKVDSALYKSKSNKKNKYTIL